MHITANPSKVIEDSPYPSNQNLIRNVYSDTYYQKEKVNSGRPPIPPNPPSPMPFNVSNGTLRRVHRNVQLIRSQVSSRV